MAGNTKRKVRARSPEVYRRLRKIKVPEAHPLFRIVPGGMAVWERARAKDSAPAAMRRSLLVLTLLAVFAWSGTTRLLAAALTRSGYEVVNVGYPAGRRRIEDLSLDLDVRLAACLRAKARRVHFVTHSFGGILLRKIPLPARPPVRTARGSGRIPEVFRPASARSTSSSA